jgi:hypothetical protein
VEIEKDRYIDACSKIGAEISNLSSEVTQLDDLLYPYKETNYSGISGIHGSYRDSELDRLSKIMNMIREQADKIRALRLSCEKLRKS